MLLLSKMKKYSNRIVDKKVFEQSFDKNNVAFKQTFSVQCCCCYDCCTLNSIKNQVKKITDYFVIKRFTIERKQKRYGTSLPIKNSGQFVSQIAVKISRIIIESLKQRISTRKKSKFFMFFFFAYCSNAHPLWIRSSFKLEWARFSYGFFNYTMHLNRRLLNRA